MIKTEMVDITVNNRQVKFYKEKGYDVKGGYKITVSVNDLPNSSHVKVDVECDNCHSIKKISYYNYIISITDSIYYCNKCKHIKTEQTNIKKYGVKTTLLEKNTIEKIKKTTKEKYGEDHYSKTIEFKEKIIEHNLKKYGVEQYFSSDKVKEDRLNKFGVEYYSQTDDYKEKYKKTISEKYGVEHYSKTNEFKDRIKDLFILNNIKKYNIDIISYENDIIEINCSKGHTYTIHKWLLKNRLQKYNIEPCTICNPINSNGKSDTEEKLLNFIKENYNNEIIISDRIILNGKELDIYLPDLKIAFEFNGLYWHNELRKENNYHLNKTENCLEKGIQLIHVWEDDWNFKQEIVKSMILNKLGKTTNKIMARKCEIKEINDNKLVKNFLNENHIQGFINSSVKIGLFYENKLVSLMTFGKKRKFMNSSSKEGEWELLRFCNKLNTNVVGGASKLFRYFNKKYSPKEVITYANRSYSNGKLYKQLGFDYIGNTQPNYYYIIDGIRYFRFRFRKDILIKEGFNLSKTEHEIMLERNIFRIYDSGSLKFKK